MRKILVDLMFVVLSATSALVIVVDATSKSNRLLASASASPSRNTNIENGISPQDNNSTSMHSETITSPVKKRGKGTSESRKGTAGKKKKKSNPSGSRSSQGGSSSSLRRIKKEYKDAVDMGIAYDWVNQRLIHRKTKSKTKTKETGRKEDNPIMCLGPITTNLRHWHFSFRGAGDNLYNKGVYHGRIVLPKDYPLSPPSVQMWTPSGRFVPFKDICLTASNYHPETWTPRWNIHGIVNALRLHMLTTPSEIGGIQSTADETIEFARLSLVWNVIFETGGGNGAKPTRITVDHQLLIRQGVIGTEPVSDEGDEMEENFSLSATEDSDAISE